MAVVSGSFADRKRFLDCTPGPKPKNDVDVIWDERGKLTSPWTAPTEPTV